MTQSPWVMRIQKGDVLRSPSGAFRIVRRVSPGISPRKTWFYFAIQRCSWTHRCYTLYNGGELMQLGWQPVAARLPLRTKFDRMIEQDFEAGPREERHFDCCDVRGIA